MMTIIRTFYQRVSSSMLANIIVADNATALRTQYKHLTRFWDTTRTKGNTTSNNHFFPRSVFLSKENDTFVAAGSPCRNFS